MKGIDEAIERISVESYDPWKMNAMIKEMYSWDNVAARTGKVYQQVLNDPPVPVDERLMR